MDLAPAWMVAVIIGREFAVTGLRSIALRARRRDSRLAARQVQDGIRRWWRSSPLILGREHLREFYVVGQIALWVAVVTAVGSALDYYRRFNHVLGKAVPDDRA